MGESWVGNVGQMRWKKFLKINNSIRSDYPIFLFDKYILKYEENSVLL